MGFRKSRVKFSPFCFTFLKFYSIIKKKDLGQLKNYQEIFNETLTRIRYHVEGAVQEDSPLMRSIVKAMYNFTDQLINNGIIEDRGQGQKYGKNNNTIL